MARHHRRYRRFKLRSFYVWHRYMGICAALFALIIAVTGLLLNHTEDFQFDSHYVKNDWLLDWYGIQAPDTLLSFAAHDQHVTLMGEHLYLNRKEIDGEYQHLVGALYLDGLFVVAVSDSILLLTARGDIVERLGSEDGMPAGIRSIGVSKEGRLVAENSVDYYQTDKDFLKWRRWEQDPNACSGPDPPRWIPGCRSHCEHTTEVRSYPSSASSSMCTAAAFSAAPGPGCSTLRRCC